MYNDAREKKMADRRRLLEKMKTHPNYAEVQRQLKQIDKQIYEEAIPYIHVKRGQAQWQVLSGIKNDLLKIMGKIRYWAETQLSMVDGTSHIDDRMYNWWRNALFELVMEVTRRQNGRSVSLGFIMERTPLDEEEIVRWHKKGITAESAARFAASYYTEWLRRYKR